MPEIGEIRAAKEIGYKGTGRLLWHACIDCTKLRWVQFRHNGPESVRCHTCANRKKAGRGEQSPTWRGGRWKDAEGYIHVKVLLDDPFYPMADKNGYIREHRLVMAKHLGRCLTRVEIVDHRDGRKDHNELSNLKLTTASPHSHKTEFEAYQLGYRDAMALKDRESSKQIRLLMWEIKQLREALQLKLGEDR